MLWTGDIYVTSVRPRKKDPSSLVLPEVSYFPCLGFFKFLLNRFEGPREEDITSVQFCESDIMH